MILDFHEMLKKATDFIVTEKGNEVISERHQKDYKKEENTITKEPTEITKDFTDISFDDI